MAAAHLIAAEEFLNPAPQSAVELFLCIVALIPYDANTLSRTGTQIAHIKLLQDMSAKHLSQLKVLHMDGISSLECVMNTLQLHMHTHYALKPGFARYRSSAADAFSARYRDQVLTKCIIEWVSVLKCFI